MQMTEERMHELGIQRRPFLKRAIAGAFAAPVVVSFGLDGIAEADSLTIGNQTMGNQFCPNMAFGNQNAYQAERFVDAALVNLNFYAATNQVSQGAANSLGDKLQTALGYLRALDQSDACGVLGAFQNELAAQTGKHVSPTAATQLSFLVTEAQSWTGCFC